MRQNASNWLELADKVWNFRRDLLTPAEASDLTGRRDELRRNLRDRADAGKLKLAIEALEGALRRAGGAIYPKSSLTEQVEFFLVAAIVILGIRTYFVQPFKIPTNSMWPTYYGMTEENFPPGVEAPGFARQVFRFLTVGAERREAIAPRSGEVMAQFYETGQMAYTLRNGRSWLVFPAKLKEYSFYVDGAPTSIRVPVDFDAFDEAMAKTFFGSEGAFAQYFQQSVREGRLMESSNRASDDTTELQPVFTLPLNRVVRKGEPVLRFDLMTGDQLFVDRLSYNFIRPRVGQGFVFRTDHIAGIGVSDYYIKRLVGVPGDVMEVRQPTLFRNGRPITGSPIFDLESEEVAPYGGYTYADDIYSPHSPDRRAEYLRRNQTLTVPPQTFFAMGDNSARSSDGRVWGFVPAKDAIGRPLFIYFPFTSRWGIAK